MKISLISVEDSITAIGFRKVAAIARQVEPSTEVCYVVPHGERRFLSLLFKKSDIHPVLSPEDLARIGAHFRTADLVCFSSMTPFAGITQEIIAEIRKVNPAAYVVWGGVHPIVNPSAAIQHADAICTGEGETAFRSFLELFQAGGDFTVTRNFWFKKDGRIIRNDFLPLQTPEILGSFPFPLYAENERIYRIHRGFSPMERKDYLSYNDLVYNTIWAIGCPYQCTYCSNSKFRENHPDYGKLRYPSVDYIIREVENALQKHPHVSTVRFHDDSFMAIPSGTLAEFGDEWKKRIGLPFWVYGVTPVSVDRGKMKTLVRAGLQRVRMGIQSGSGDMLRFYKRPDRPGLIVRSMATISEFSRWTSPPFYDIIVDNPIETRQDIVDTLELIYQAPRPFTLFIYSLRIIPGTAMAKDFERLGVEAAGTEKGYISATPCLSNALLFLLSVFRPPGVLFRRLLDRVLPYGDKPGPTLLFPLARLLYRIQVAAGMILSFDFSIFPGRTGWWIWKSGIIRILQRRKLNRVFKEIAQV